MGKERKQSASLELADQLALAAFLAQREFLSSEVSGTHIGEILPSTSLPSYIRRLEINRALDLARTVTHSSHFNHDM